MSEVSEEYYKKLSSTLISSAPTELYEMFKHMDLNALFTSLLNIYVEKKPSIKVTNFTLSKLAIPIEGYDEPQEYVIDDLSPLTIMEILESIPLKVSILYNLEIGDLSRIKLKGSGELKLHRKDGELIIEAENEWDIEEVSEIEPNEPKDHSRLIRIAEMVIAGFIVEIPILFLLKFLNM